MREESQIGSLDNVNDDVFVRSYHNKQKWVPGKVIQKTGPLSFRIRTSDGVMKRHQDQVRISDHDFHSEAFDSSHSDESNTDFSCMNDDVVQRHVNFEYPVVQDENANNDHLDR